jgi:uncharacterized membrane protein
MAFMEPESYDSGGTSIARPGTMARRVAAFIGMVGVIALMLFLMWQIHLHHEAGAPNDEPAIVLVVV